jgi:hypothetical protein
MSGKSLCSLVRQVHPQRDVSTCQRPQLFEGYQGRKHLHKTNFLHFPQRAALLFQGDLRALHTVLDKPLPRLPSMPSILALSSFFTRANPIFTRCRPLLSLGAPMTFQHSLIFYFETTSKPLEKNTSDVSLALLRKTDGDTNLNTIFIFTSW